MRRGDRGRLGPAWAEENRPIPEGNDPSGLQEQRSRESSQSPEGAQGVMNLSRNTKDTALEVYETYRSQARNCSYASKQTLQSLPCKNLKSQ